LRKRPFSADLPVTVGVVKADSASERAASNRWVLRKARERLSLMVRVSSGVGEQARARV
jgi:hypothetical protein